MRRLQEWLGVYKVEEVDVTPHHMKLAVQRQTDEHIEKAQNFQREMRDEIDFILRESGFK